MKRERLSLISNKENFEDLESHDQIDEDLSQWQVIQRDCNLLMDLLSKINRQISCHDPRPQETSSKSDGANEIALERSEAGRIQRLRVRLFICS